MDVLLSSLHHPPPVTKVGSGGMSIPERPAQLLLLQDSLLKIKDYKVRSNDPRLYYYTRTKLVQAV